MFRGLANRILALVRRALGIKLLIDEGRHREQKLFFGQRKALFAIGNAIKYSTAHPAEVRRSVPYGRAVELIRLLAPVDVTSAGFVRVGRDHDGGYVMLDAFSPRPDAAYSLGIADDTSWDADIADRGIDVYMYDHTISKLPADHSRFHFFRHGICGQPDAERPRLKTLETVIAENGHTSSHSLLLKMDIEGDEWPVIAASSESSLQRFSQIVVEFHGLACVYDGAAYRRIRDCLMRLNRTHQSVHVHANGHEIPAWIGDLVLPDLLEVTWVRRKDYEGRFAPCSRLFPTELDQCSAPGWQDIYLGDFQAK
jgi:hypothetical protein